MPRASSRTSATQPGEETWDIARRYRLPRAQLMEMSPGLENAEPTPGQSVVVWHRQLQA